MPPSEFLPFATNCVVIICGNACNSRPSLVSFDLILSTAVTKWTTITYIRIRLTFLPSLLFLLYFCIPVCPDKVDAAFRLVFYMETKSRREKLKQKPKKKMGSKEKEKAFHVNIAKPWTKRIGCVGYFEMQFCQFYAQVFFFFFSKAVKQVRTRHMQSVFESITMLCLWPLFEMIPTVVLLIMCAVVEAFVVVVVVVDWYFFFRSHIFSSSLL